MRRSLPLVAVLVALALLAGAGRLHAQLVEGTVRAAVTGRPISGAVVVGLDSAGVARGRSLTDERGWFRLQAAGARRVRVTRIGFTPVEQDLAARGALAIEMRPIPATLTTVRVTGRAVCPGGEGREGVVAAWEQARAALLSAVVAREQRDAAVSLIGYERRLDGAGRRVVSETREVRRARSSRPYVAAASAATLASAGYMLEQDGERTFLAPDADVLLDPAFAETHCFAVVADRGRPGEVGLRFTPARERPRFVDIEGTLWMRRSPAALRALDFRYTGLERAAERIGAGGSLEFATLPNGAVIISRWSIRMPVLAARPRRGSGIPGGEGPGLDHYVAAVHETGGVVAEAVWADGATFVAASATVAGTVRRDGTDAPVPGAIVELEGVGTRTAADSLGRFALAIPIGGEYTLAVTDTAFPAGVDAVKAAREVVVRDGAQVDVAVRLPSEESTAAALCATVPGRPPGAGTSRETATIVGRIAVPVGTPQGLHLTATWLAQVTANGRVLRTGETTQSIELDESGAFFFCDVVRDRPIRIGVRRGQVALADTILRVDTPGAVRRVALVADLASRGRVAQELAPVTVEAEAPARSPNLRDFEARRQSGMGGDFIDDATLRGNEGPLSPIFARRLTGVRLIHTGTHTYLVSSRGARNGTVCFIDIYIDGLLHTTGNPNEPVDIARLNTREFAAVEFYDGAATIPPQFNRTARNNCGVLLLWTREQ